MKNYDDLTLIQKIVAARQLKASGRNRKFIRDALGFSNNLYDRIFSIGAMDFSAKELAIKLGLL